MKKVLFITNPVAGTMKSRSAMFDIVNVFCKAGYQVTAQVTQKRGHAIELAERAAEEGYDIVVCCGGDGTMNEVVTGVIRSGSGIPIGYIPAGSTNDFADNLGLATIPAVAAQRICSEEPFMLDAGLFNSTDFFTYVASFGAFTDASYSAPQELKNVLGHFAYLMEGLKDITNIKAHRVTVTTDSESFSGKYIFGAISNTKRMAGLVHIPVTTEELHDGMFEVTLVKYPNNIGELNDIAMGVAAGEFRENPMFTYLRSSRIELTMAKSMDWSLDGEKKHGQSHILIENIHDALTLYK